MARRWTRYWNFSMGVGFMASSRRPVGCQTTANRCLWVGLLTSLCLHLVALDCGRGQAVRLQELADLWRIGHVIVSAAVHEGE